MARPLRLAGAEADLVAPWAPTLHHRVDGGQRPGGALDDPRCRGHYVARWEGAVGQVSRDHRGTAPSLLGRLGAREPVVPLRAMRQAIGRPDPRHTVRPPRCARPRPRAHALERGRQGQVAADCGALADARKDLVLGRPARLPRCLAGHPHLGLPPRASAEASQARAAPGACGASSPAAPGAASVFCAPPRRRDGATRAPRRGPRAGKRGAAPHCVWHVPIGDLFEALGTRAPQPDGAVPPAMAAGDCRCKGWARAAA
jgi:hypothetical protein